MKKVDIITMHRVVNYGSVLQAYATQEVIKQMGYNSEIIDYYPERMHLLGMLKRIKNKNKEFEKNLLLRNIARLVIFPSYLKRFYIFKKFVKKYLIITPHQYLNINELKLNKPQADIYCTGSDQVWNTGWNEKIDTAFYLDFCNENNKCISYAASFGKGKLEDWEKKDTKKLLEKYERISVRESSGIDILRDIGIENGVNVLDPTLLLNGDEWKKISSSKFKKDKYILVYNLNRNKKIDNYAKNLSKKTGLKIKYLSYQLHEFYKKGKMYCNPKVEMFLDLIANAEYVVSDSFHATAFSLNFNRKFIIVYPNKFSSRIQSILKITGLENRVARDENDLSVIDNEIDYKKVNEIMEKERKKSLNWLKDSLK